MDQHVESLSGQILEGPELDWQKYEEITVNIWLANGIHHFIQCDHKITPNSKLGDLPLLCRDDDTRRAYYPVRRNAQPYDNVKYYVRPLDCEEVLYFAKR